MEQVMSPHQKILGLTFSGETRDWPDWSFRFEALAAQLGFLEVMTRTSSETDAAKKEAANKQAYYTIVSSMRGDGLRVVRRAKKGDGSEAWKILNSRYNSAAEARKDMLQAQLFDESRLLHDNDDVATFIDSLEDLRKQLEDIGVKIGTDAMMGRIKRALPSSYDPLLAALQLRRHATITELSPEEREAAKEKVYEEVIDEIKLFGEERRIRVTHRNEVAMRTNTLRTKSVGRPSGRFPNNDKLSWAIRRIHDYDTAIRRIRTDTPYPTEHSIFVMTLGSKILYTCFTVSAMPPRSTAHIERHFNITGDSSQHNLLAKCKYCESTFSCSSSRLIFHIACLPGNGIKPCPTVSPLRSWQLSLRKS